MSFFKNMNNVWMAYTLAVWSLYKIYDFNNIFETIYSTKKGIEKDVGGMK